MIVLEAVTELPQPSEAVNVLVCEALQALVTTVPSVNVMIGIPQAAVAVAEPRAALISDEAGLQPSVPVGDTIIVGGLGAFIQVTVLEAVAELPQPSTAVNVLVCEALHEEVTIAASVTVIVVGPQASVADAEPRALLISDEAGLQPSEVAVPLAVMVGAIRSLVQLTVREVVDVLPQPSTAVNVLVCEALHEEVTIAASVTVIVVGPQASVADAEPRAAVISDAAGLQPSVTLE